MRLGRQYNKMKSNKRKRVKIFKGVLGVIGFAGFIGMAGSVGSMELDLISWKMFVVQVGVSMLMLGSSVWIYNTIFGDR